MGFGPFRVGGRLPVVGCLPLLAVMAVVGFFWSHPLVLVLLGVAIALCVAVAAKEGRLPHQRRRDVEPKTEPVPVVRQGRRR